MSLLKEFDEFVTANQGRKMSVTKLKGLNNPEAGRQSEVPEGAPFVGKVTLLWRENTRYGDGFQVLVDQGWGLTTSLVREVSKKSDTKWLAKTMNSIYKIEVVG